MAACVGTWPFSFLAVEIAKEKLLNKGSCTEAIECGIAAIEDDFEMGRYFVGRGGAPNSSGVLQCDAAVMSGVDMSFGAVAALEGVATPICVASRVRTKSRHSLLVGGGAQRFAIEEGFSIEPNENLIQKRTEEPTDVADGVTSGNGVRNELTFGDHSHDTIALLALDEFQNIAAGASTSGLSGKFPGRVGDSPLPGCGLYADNLAGAACCTGDGDEIMKFCPSFHVVQLLKQGAQPEDACQQVLREIHTRVGHKDMFEIGIMALNLKGQYGAASTVKSFGDTYTGFPYCVWNEGQEAPVVLCAQPML